MLRTYGISAVALGAICFGISAAHADKKKPAEPVALDAAHRATAQKHIDLGIKWLLAQREKDGGWSLGKGAARPAVTAMALKALVQHPKYDTKHPDVKKAFAVLLKYRQKNGGIYDPRQGQQNYTTAVAVMAMVAARDPKLKPALDGAVRYLKGLQIQPGSESPDGVKIDEDHPFRGGVSYGKHGRPDLSNVSMWMQALHDAGVKADDPAMKNALVFVTRTQNLSETNPRPWAKTSSNDGGFAYAAALAGDFDQGESKANEAAGGGLRSYGSMTYAGFKSLLYAGLDEKDPRVRGAFKWIRRYWRLDSNPNMPALRSKQGLYYYYHTFAKALRAWGKPVIVDVKGAEHNWRHELIDMLASQAKKDGHWINEAARWYEGHPLLATNYAILSLQECLKK